MTHEEQRSGGCHSSWSLRFPLSRAAPRRAQLRIRRFRPKASWSGSGSRRAAGGGSSCSNCVFSARSAAACVGGGLTAASRREAASIALGLVITVVGDCFSSTGAFASGSGSCPSTVGSCGSRRCPEHAAPLLARQPAAVAAAGSNTKRSEPPASGPLCVQRSPRCRRDAQRCTWRSPPQRRRWEHIGQHRGSAALGPPFAGRRLRQLAQNRVARSHLGPRRRQLWRLASSQRSAVGRFGLSAGIQQPTAVADPDLASTAACASSGESAATSTAPVAERRGSARGRRYILVSCTYRRMRRWGARRRYQALRSQTIYGGDPFLERGGGTARPQTLGRHHRFSTLPAFAPGCCPGALASGCGAGCDSRNVAIACLAVRSQPLTWAGNTSVASVPRRPRGPTGARHGFAASLASFPLAAAPEVLAQNLGRKAG